MPIIDPSAPSQIALRLGVLDLILDALSLVRRDLAQNETLHAHAYQILKDFLPKETYKTFLTDDSSMEEFLDDTRRRIFSSLRRGGISAEDATRLAASMATSQLEDAVAEIRNRFKQKSSPIPAPPPLVLEHAPVVPDHYEDVEPLI